jgi:serine/threonine protein kinase
VKDFDRENNKIVIQVDGWEQRYLSRVKHEDSGIIFST